ncbi:hypothetical protein BDN67DRAFT_1045132 [Paxillus ammoniavirescens]|nr:hypothetical protein BDN67DRAFT_1045132 [Paxillus ammoniavirescens]
MPSLKGILLFARLLTTTDRKQRIPITFDMLFPAEWLDAKAEEDPEGQTNRDIQSALLHHRFEMTQPQTLMGSLSQMSAGMTHRVTPDRLRKISAAIPKVLILSAAEDNLIHYSEGEYLKSHMPEAEYQFWEKMGHGVEAICHLSFRIYHWPTAKVTIKGQRTKGKH